MYMISPVQETQPVARPRQQGLFQIGGGHPGFGGLPGMSPRRSGNQPQRQAGPVSRVPSQNQPTGGGKPVPVRRGPGGATAQMSADIARRKREEGRLKGNQRREAARKARLAPGGLHDQMAFTEQLSKRGLLSPMPSTYGRNQMQPPPMVDDPMRFLLARP